MNPILGWSLAAIAIAVSYQAYRWQGVVVALTVIVFWLLLQFSRALRLMRDAGQAPKGQVGSAVMLNAKLHAGMTLMQVIRLTQSLGDRVDGDNDRWAWRDESGSRVTLAFKGAKLAEWSLERPAETAPAETPIENTAEARGATPPPAA